MTTPLEAQELAKRLRKLAHHRWSELTDEMLLGLLIDAAKEAADAIEAAAFLSHPVNTEQGVTEDEVERACEAYAKGTGYYVTFHRGLSSESSDRMRSGMRAALTAARTPLASVEGADVSKRCRGQWCDRRDGITCADGECDIESGIYTPPLAQSGRSSAEPVAYPRMQIVRAHKYTCANVQIGSTAENKCDCGALDTAGQAIPVPPAALTPPVGPQEAVAVSLEQQFRPMAGYDKNQPGYQYREGWNAAIRHVMDLQRASSPPNGDAP